MNTIFDFKYEAELLDDDIELQVAYCVIGQDRPATMIDPAEYAEIELRSVSIDGHDLLPEMSIIQIGLIEEAAWDDLRERAADAMVDRHETLMGDY